MTTYYYTYDPNLIKDEAHYIALQHMAGFEIGDKVRITGVAMDDQGYWDNVWTRAMHGLVGKVRTIEAIGFGASGIRIDYFYYAFPFFVLEKVEE